MQSVASKLTVESSPANECTLHFEEAWGLFCGTVCLDLNLSAVFKDKNKVKKDELQLTQREAVYWGLGFRVQGFGFQVQEARRVVK